MYQIPANIAISGFLAASWDAPLLFFWLGGSLLYVFYARKGRILNALLSIYISKLFLLELNLGANFLPASMPPAVLLLQQIVIFSLIFLIVFFLFSSYGLRLGRNAFGVFSGFFTSVIFSILQIGLLINIVLSLMPVKFLENFSSLILKIFVDFPAGVIWLVLPLFSFVLINKLFHNKNYPE